MEFIDVLRLAVKQGASDIHLVIGKSPMVRINGEVLEMPGFPALMASMWARYSLSCGTRTMLF